MFVKVVSAFWISRSSSTITKVRHNYSEICSLCWSQKCVCVFWRYLLQIISHYLMNFEQCVLYCSDENFALFEFLLCSFFKTHHAIYLSRRDLESTIVLWTKISKIVQFSQKSTFSPCENYLCKIQNIVFLNFFKKVPHPLINC